MDVKEELTTGNDTDKAAELLRRRQEQEELLAEDERLGKLISDQRLEKGVGEEDEAEAEKKIKEYLMTHNEGKAHNEYLVRGAELRCSCGSHTRKMNLNLCHGVYIKGHPAVHELDCVSGEGNNITCFGICGGEEFEAEEAVVVGEDGKRRRGPKCEPKLVGIWWDSYDGTKIVDNDDKMQDDSGNPIGCNTLTVGSFLVCQHGGIISPVNSGQDRTVEAEDFVDGWIPYKEVVNLKDNNEKNSLPEEQLLAELPEDSNKRSDDMEGLINALFLNMGFLAYEGLADLSLTQMRRFLMGNMAEYIKNCRENEITFKKFNKFDVMCMFGRDMIEYLRNDLSGMANAFVTRLKQTFAGGNENSMLKRAEAFAAQKTSAAQILFVWDLLRCFGVSQKTINENLDHNEDILIEKKDNDESGEDTSSSDNDKTEKNPLALDMPDAHIENQREWENVHYGNTTMKFAGCEIFAVYNARYSLGEEMGKEKLLELIGIFEKEGATLAGKAGSSPLSIYVYFKKNGYDVGATDSFQKEDINAMGEKYDTIIITFLNNERTLGRAIHTVNISKKEGKYFIHNDYLLVNGKFVEKGGFPDLWGTVLELSDGHAKPIFIMGVNKKV